MKKERETKKIIRKQRKTNRGRMINKDILKVSVFIGILFLAMTVYFVYFVGFKSESVINNTYNKRSEELKKQVTRGSIYARNGETLAETIVGEDGSEVRSYPYGNIFAHVVGYEDNGGLGLENSYNYYMLSANINILEKIKNEFNGVKSVGNSINTTLDLGLQQTISSILDSAGNSACIALDPETGEILSVVSKPDFDPNTISSIWDEIAGDENNSILVNRATQGLYAPGSTFKIFTLYEYMLENADSYESYSYDCTGEITLADMTLHCYDYTAHGNESLMQSFAYSCNCSFANIGVSLNLSKFKSTNEKLLFNTDLPLDIDSNQSSFSLDKDSDEQLTMQTAIGQGNTLVSPAHLALVMSAIANNGKLMKPHLVSSVVNSNETTIKTFDSEVYEKLFSKSEAKTLKEYLKDVVNEGTGNVLAYGNYEAYGKTGTAETISNYNVDAEAADHSWFVGGAESGDKNLVICVMVENAQNTQTSAVQIAKQVFDYYFQ